MIIPYHTWYHGIDTGSHGFLSCGRMQVQVKMLRKGSADGNRREETCQGNDQEYGEGSMAKRKTELWKARQEG